MRDLEGKLALVTGGGKGVGKVVARELAARGAHILLNFFHSLDQAKETKAELEAAGAAVDVFRASVAKPEQVTRMFEEIEERFGYLDILVNNSASGRLIPVSAVDDEAFARAFDTNVKGSFWCARAAAPLMARRGGGCIVNVSSIGADLVPANYVVVGTSKAALEALTRYLAAEFAPLNIRVNTASATLIDGDVARAFPDFEQVVEVTIASTPLGRLATAEDLAGVIMFLTSDQSRFMTGQTVLADGGLSLGTVMMSPRTKAAPAQAEAPGTPQALRVPELSVPTPVAPAPRPEPEARPADETGDPDGLAVVGMGLVVPGASSPDEFWKVLIDGPDLFRRVPDDRWDYRSFYSEDAGAEDKTYSASSVFITDFAPEPGLTDGLSGDTAGDDSTALWLRHALLQAFRGVHRREGDRYNFVVGYTADGSQHLEESQVVSGMAHRLAEAMEQSAVPPDEAAALQAAIDEALRAHYRRGAAEPIRYLPHNVGLRAMEGVLPEETELVMVDTACSSSLYTVDIGVKGLLMGRQDIAVCGGSFSLAPRGSVLFSKLHGLSASGILRPLDKDADGVLFSDGAGVVVIKRLQRAREDGDRILGVLKAFGSSSDGKGKAIYAPSSHGQQIAVKRAHGDIGGQPPGVDWIIAHATGTPAGDLAEFSGLRETYAGERPVYVTSNKSLIGHTGWAAGAVSVIEGILGFQNATIPPQHQWDEAPADFEIETTNLTIPTAPVPWPSQTDTPRRVAISGFGFGGTNAHMVLEEYPSPVAAAPSATRPPYTGRIAVVGWSACVPELEEREQVSTWLAGDGPAPARSFGDFYPMPPFEKVRMPPAMIRTIDRCQLMVIECAHQLQEQLGEFWDANRARTGVILGHLGATRSSTLYAGRTYIDEVEQLLRANPKLSGSTHLEPLLGALRAEVQRLVPASNENSFPGMMPNVIPARIANYFDLNGLNMTVDTGVSSALAAVQVGIGYLRSGELEMALVGGANGNTTPEMRRLLEGRFEPDDDLAEGTFILAVTTEERALEAGLPIHGFLSEGPSAVPSNGDVPVVDCSSAATGAHYLGAEGALAVLRALHTDDPETVVTCREARLGARTSVTVTPPIPEEGAREERPAAGVVPAQFLDAEEYAPGDPVQVKRQVVVLDTFPLEAVRPPLEFIPPETVVLTDRPELLAPLADRLSDALVLTTVEPAGGSGYVFLPSVTPEAVADAIETWGRPLRHIRVVADLGASAPAPDCLWEEWPALVALHDLAFLTLKSGFDGLGEEGSSCIGLFLDAVPDGNVHPLGGLFSGLMKSTALELPGCLIYSLFTSERDLPAGVRQAEDESRAKHYLPLLVYDGDARKTIFLDEEPGELSADTPARLDSGSVVVAVGGARGITAEVMKTIAEHFRPRLYLIATTRLDAYSPEVFEGSDAEFSNRRAEYIRTERAAHPEKNPGQLNKEFDRMLAARDARANLDDMARHCGADRVTYVAADVLDREAIGAVLDRVLDAEGKIDLLINAPGINRAASIPQKSLSDFRSVRDLKLRAYQNLKWALRERPPRTWCNFGSFIGLTGQLGETDYASGNDLLSTGAGYSSRALDRDEFTIGWTLWRDVGMGANPITKGFLEKSGLFTSMATAEGAHHFMRELNLPRHEPFIIHLGVPERQAIETYRPGFFEARADVGADAASPGFYLGRVLSRERDGAMFERVFDLHTDAYLDAHVVNGYPTLPGTFVTEVGAEAAAYLFPDLHVVALEDARFHHFLRVYESDRPIPKRIEAKVLEQDGDHAAVRVRILTDVVAPNGTVLARDKLHHEITAVMAREYPPAPIWEAWPADGEVPVPDPYHLRGAPVLLTGPLVSTKDTRSNPQGKRAAYSSNINAEDPAFSRFIVPSVLLDGLARVAVLEFVEREYIPLAAPSSIRRIDLYEPGNDTTLAQRYDPIELYVTPKQMTLEDPSAPNRFVAVRPDGRMILQMKDVVGIILGYVHHETGEYVAREEVERVSLAASDVPAPTGA
jgi:NAD(P)-dependent dehydrogenase (short-subunit alcohol dehydrogenase family)/3-oxoacyl-(acyl-carrier-protein) synthase